MAKWQYIGDDVRVIPDLSREVKPGDVVELDNETPGGLFKKVADNRKVTAAADIDEESTEA